MEDRPIFLDWLYLNECTVDWRDDNARGDGGDDIDDDDDDESAEYDGCHDLHALRRATLHNRAFLPRDPWNHRG